MRLILNELDCLPHVNMIQCKVFRIAEQQILHVIRVYTISEICFGADDISDNAGPHSAVGNVSGYRCGSDCRSRGREFDPGPVPYFRGDWS